MASFTPPNLALIGEPRRPQSIATGTIDYAVPPMHNDGAKEALDSQIWCNAGRRE